MNKTAFHRAQLLMLVAALVFGQVGAGFLHNKHDAHEAIVDMDHPVLVNHGEHCKVCAVDWVHQFVGSYFDIVLAEEINIFPKPVSFYSSLNPSRLLTKDRAPPIFS